MNMPGTNSSGGLPPLTAHTAISTWQLAGLADVLAVLAALAYLYRAYRTLPRAGHRWALGRTVAFLGALAIAVLTLNSAIDIYADELFWLHMVEHLILIMVVPALLIIGQPLALLTTGADRTSRASRSALDSGVTSVLTFPLFGVALYAVVLIGTHLTGFMQLMLTHMWLHNVEIVAFLVSGYLYFLPLLGDEPLKRQLSYPLRVFLLLMGMTVDTVVGVMLMMSSSEPFPAYAAQHRTWGPGLLDDIHTGGGIMWVVGDGLMFLITVLLVRRWMADTERQNDTGKWLEAARRSTIANMGVTEVGAAADEDNIDDDDAALAAYNRMLLKLNQKDNETA